MIKPSGKDSNDLYIQKGVAPSSSLDPNISTFILKSVKTPTQRNNSNSLNFDILSTIFPVFPCLGLKFTYATDFFVWLPIRRDQLRLNKWRDKLHLNCELPLLLDQPMSFTFKCKKGNLITDGHHDNPVEIPRSLIGFYFIRKRKIQ